LLFSIARKCDMLNFKQLISVRSYSFYVGQRTVVIELLTPLIRNDERLNVSLKNLAYKV
jgi:hypothetical protein